MSSPPLAETQAPFSLEDLRQNFERLQADLKIVQNELDQALGVWRSILATEKQEFKKLLDDHKKTWDRDDQQWQKDRQAYEQKIKEMEDFFNKQLSSTEQNAVRALNELDSAWQQERQRWQNTVTQQTRETHQREELQTASQLQLQQRLAQLEEENARLQARLTETESQQGDQAQQLQQTQETWGVERQQNEALVQSLQQEVATLEERCRSAEASRWGQQRQLESYIETLDQQISALTEFIQKVLPSHPLRRKTDQPSGSPGTTGLYPPRAAH